MLSQFINPAYAPRFANIGVAIALFLFALVVPHDANPTMLDCFGAALIGTFECMAMIHSQVRFANTFMGALMIIQSSTVHQFLPWTHFVELGLGALVILLSFVPSPEMPGTELDVGNPDKQHH